MFEIAKPRPPHVRFERRAVEKRKLVEEGGESYYVDVDFACITPIGDKDTRERSVVDWFAQLDQDVRNDRFPAEWLEAYRKMYAAFQKGEELPIDGTALRTWPGLSPKEVQLCIGLHILTVEDLAAANEATISRLGMGGRALKMRAEEFLKAKGDSNTAQRVEALILGFEALKVRNEQLESDNKSLQAQVSVLMNQSQGATVTRQPSLEDRLADRQTEEDPEDRVLRSL